jgi:hypothetical protein
MSVFNVVANVVANINNNQNNRNNNNINEQINKISTSNTQVKVDCRAFISRTFDYRTTLKYDR